MNKIEDMINEYNEIKTVKTHVEDTLEKLSKKKDILLDILKKYIKKSEEGNVYFGLDSFLFQTKMVELEYTNLYEMKTFIMNKIYGSYYKLYCAIHEFLNNYCKEKKVEEFREMNNYKTYPIYKDLEQFIDYNEEHINNIHNDIILFFNKIGEIINNNEKDIKKDEEQVKIGLNLGNYVYHSKYVNNTIVNKLAFFENVLTMYHKYHNEMLNRLCIKLFVMWRLLDKDIKLASFQQNDEETRIINSKLDELNKHVPSPGNVDVSYVFDSSLSQASSLSMAIEDIKDECISIKDDNNLEDISNNKVLSKSQKKRLKQKRNKANQIIKNI